MFSLMREILHAWRDVSLSCGRFYMLGVRNSILEWDSHSMRESWQPWCIYLYTVSQRTLVPRTSSAHVFLNLFAEPTSSGTRCIDRWYKYKTLKLLLFVCIVFDDDNCLKIKCLWNLDKWRVIYSSRFKKKSAIRC